MDDRSTRLNLNGPTGPVALSFLEADLRSMHGDRGLRRFGLRCQVRLSLEPDALEADGVTAIWLWADVTASRDSNVPLRLGRVSADEPVFLGGTDGGPQRHPARVATASLAFELDALQMEALETVRAGGSLIFTFRLGGVALHHGAYGSVVATSDIRHPVAQSEWAELLTNVGYGTVITIEVPLTNHPIPQVAEALAQSLAALIRGEWEEAVADCRPGLKALAAAGDAKYKLQPWSRDAGKDERFWRAVQGLLSVTHAAHHPESAKDAATADDAARPATRIHWTRDDALAVIGGLASLARQRVP